MEIKEGLGGCFWLFMFIMFLIGLATFPAGILVWAVQLLIIWKIVRS